MRKRIIGVAGAFVALSLLTWALAGPRDEQWKKVKAAVDKGYPKTAIQELEPIIAAALKDKAYPEAIKAIAQRIALEANIQGNKPEERITRMQEAIAKSPAEMQPVMDAVLANWYWHYFQQNQWRFMQRTATAGPVGDDILTWDLPRILGEISNQFTKALAAEKTLKATPIAEYDALLEKGNVPDAYRPTLYDFLAHNAIHFYSAGVQAGAKAEDAFVLNADSPIFGTAEQFVEWTPEATDTDSPTLKALRLYQNLLRFHHDDENKTAFADADLNRLRFGFNAALGESKNNSYKVALEKFAERWQKHEIAAQAWFQWATVLQTEGDLVEARRLAAHGLKSFPNSIGGRQCFNLVEQIEAKSSNVTTERVWNEPLPVIQVRYRNVTKIYFKAVAWDYMERFKASRYRPEQLDENEQKQLLAKAPTKEWSEDLPATEDYQQRTIKLTAPKDLKAGFYFLIASHDPKFGADDNQVTFSNFFVSNLALVIRMHQGEGLLEGFVLDAISGDPIANVEVRGWYRTQNNTRVAATPVKTDQNGLFKLTGPNSWGYLVYAKHKDQELATGNEYYVYDNRNRPDPFTSTVFFTDRSLYRPGQTIQYKGICIRADQENNQYETLADKTLTVVLSDHNGKEVMRQQHRSNDYGSFSGSFTAPAGRVTGRMILHVVAGPGGQTNVSVEEYKRPKFEVTLEKPKTPSKLNTVVTIDAKAMAYTGAAVDAGNVRYRVVRQVRYPHWWHSCYWWRPAPPQPSQEIAHGFTVTAIDGTFKVHFQAQPDLSVPEKDEPIFKFTVYADVTDTTGETRSGQITINVGYTALQANLTASDWLTDDKAVSLNVRTSTLDDEPQAAAGTIKVYRLKEPEKVHRQKLVMHEHMPRRVVRGKIIDPKPEPDLSNPNSWELGEVVVQKNFETDATGTTTLSVPLKVGAYRAMLETRDRYGKVVTAQLPLKVLDPDAKELAIKVPNVVAAPSWSVEPGKDFTALWGSGYDKARAFIEIEQRHRPIQAYWTEADRTQVAIKQAVTEALRGGFTLRVTMVRENRAYLESRRVDVPWSNKDLTIRWEHFVSKLEPGQKEKWTAIITGPDAKRAVAEMVAGLYDESLDAYLPHDWMKKFGVFRHDHTNVVSQFENRLQGFQHLLGHFQRDAKDVKWAYRSFPADITVNLWGYQYFRRDGMALGAAPAEGREMQKSALRQDANGYANADRAAAKSDGEFEQAAGQAGQPPAPPQGPSADFSKVSARKNLNETAFFFPNLVANKDGEVKLEFTMPEALTRWKFLGFAHDRDLRAGYLQDHVVTARELMVQPTAPRFLREGDQLEFTVKVSNQSDKIQNGTARLTLTDVKSGKSADTALGNNVTDQTFEIPAKESRTFSWKLSVPYDQGFLSYKALATTGSLTDGEEGYLPVLSSRVLVTESLPLPIRGPLEKTFKFTRLLDSGKSDSLKHQQVTVQMVSNPNWYAVMALPYLMDYPYHCTEQTFNRLYANSLARHIANSDPKIRTIFDQWKNTPALDSPLEKNKDLLAVALEETPWVKQAQNESQARRSVGILFDENRLNHETADLLRRLADAQHADGAWPWFPGGPANDYITLYITTGFGRLRHLGVKLDSDAPVKSLTRLDGWIDRTYREILKRGKDIDKNHLSPTIALYLYGRSFFLQDKAVAKEHKAAVDYFLGQAKTHWLQLANRQSQAHLALALKRFGDTDSAKGIMRSIQERSVTNEELGMFWRDLELSWWWFRAPIETQAMMIEAFDEVMDDAKSVEECKVWLLKQKQTQDWKTTKATADAIYGLLLRGDGNPLASDVLVEVSLGGNVIRPEKVEAGTGFYEQRFPGNEVKPDMGTITVKKIDKGVSWGSVHWQYLEDVSKLTPYEGTPLTLKKALFTRVYSKKGPVLYPVQDALQVGDELVTRLELRVDRDMEYVHLKDARGSGTEPTNVLSKYKFQDGLAYYESTRDTASHFFIDYLPKGTYVFEYATRVVHRGEYQTGMAQIQCMYAPEFNSHSESFKLTVR